MVKIIYLKKNVIQDMNFMIAPVINVFQEPIKKLLVILIVPDALIINTRHNMGKVNVIIVILVNKLDGDQHYVNHVVIDILKMSL